MFCCFGLCFLGLLHMTWPCMAKLWKLMRFPFPNRVLFWGEASGFPNQCMNAGIQATRNQSNHESYPVSWDASWSMQYHAMGCPSCPMFWHVGSLMTKPSPDGVAWANDEHPVKQEAIWINGNFLQKCGVELLHIVAYGWILLHWKIWFSHPNLKPFHPPLFSLITCSPYQPMPQYTMQPCTHQWYNGTEFIEIHDFSHGEKEVWRCGRRDMERPCDFTSHTVHFVTGSVFPCFSFKWWLPWPMTFIRFRRDETKQRKPWL